MGVRCGLLRNGGGGIALRSSSCFVTTGGSIDVGTADVILPFPSTLSFFVALTSNSSIVGASSRVGFDVKLIDGRRSHCVISHEDGGFL